jgi:hypothetical protein
MIFSLLLATLYGALFHLWQGGDGRRLIVYILSSWLGFAIGQFIADMLHILVLNVGTVHAFSATLGAWVSLGVTRALVPAGSKSSSS